jgi:hypothetical protein
MFVYFVSILDRFHNHKNAMCDFQYYANSAHSVLTYVLSLSITYVLSC